MADDDSSFSVGFDELDTAATTFSSDEGGPAELWPEETLFLSLLVFHLSKLDPPGKSGFGIDEEEMK